MEQKSRTEYRLCPACFLGPVVVSVVVSANEHENSEKRIPQNRNISRQKEIRFQSFLTENGTFFLELMTRIELVTSSLPRMRSTG